MNLAVVWKVLIAIVALIVVNVYIGPLLVPLLPPLGIICLIAIYLGIVAWLFGWIGN